jgi:hypothetical protein
MYMCMCNTCGRFKVQLPRAMTAMLSLLGIDIGKKTEVQVKTLMETFGKVCDPFSAQNHVPAHALMC